MYDTFLANVYVRPERRGWSTFLPRAICAFDGIENFLRHEIGPVPTPSKYPNYYNKTIIQTIGIYLKERLARSGKVRVSDANRILWIACMRYSRNPERSYESMSIEGAGTVVLNKYGNAVGSFDFYDAREQVAKATQAPVGPWSDRQTRRLSATFALCRWCQRFVDTTRFTKTHWDGHFCESRLCRHLSWLAYTPISRGGIGLTYKQRASAPGEHADVLRLSNFLSLKAKQAKRKTHEQRNSN
jgi:hypothetical protein